MKRCPYCPFETDDPREERAHMEAEHPKVIEQRMIAAGFQRDPQTGEWIDTLAGED
jgi:2-iminoacetate synthase ThiH